MIEINKKQIKKIQLEILNELDRVCSRLNLQYFLSNGTLLGAVKNGGFLPWDDDIDVLMLREDYEVLVDYYGNQNNPANLAVSQPYARAQADTEIRYCLLDWKQCTKYYYPFGKLVDTQTVLREHSLLPIPRLGVHVDIFPMDKLPCKLWKRFLYMEGIRFSNFLRYHTVKMKRSSLPDPENFRKASEYRQFMEEVIPPTLMGQWRYALCKAYIRLFDARYPRKSWGNLVRCGLTQTLPGSAFSTTGFLPFEGRSYPVPGGYKDYLQVKFGDISRDFSPEQQCTIHQHKAWAEQENSRVP